MILKEEKQKRQKKHGNTIMRLFRRALALLLCCCMLYTSAVSVQAAKYPSGAIAIGIDVSKYQGVIDWPQVAASGVKFAFVRLGSVKYGIDSMFDYNMQMAQACGIKTGVYVYSYAKSPEEAVNEALFMAQAIAPYTVNMPVVIDIEDNSQRSLPPATVAQIANTFCVIMETAGYYPMIYASKNWFEKEMGPVAYDKWVAQYNSSCAMDDAAFWQASCTGRIPGIAGNVDIDYQYKDLSAQIVQNGFVYRKGFYYFYENYKMKLNTLVKYQDAIYYLDAFGRRVSGLAQIGNDISYFDAEGKMAFGWQNIAGNTYYFGTEGKMAFGLQKIGDSVYYFDAAGCMLRGWQNLANQLFYFGEDGHMATGFSLIGNDYYLFNENGVLQAGFQNIGGQTYYFDPANPKMAKGWTAVGTGLYYFDPATGIMARGFQQIGGAIYYFDMTTGQMALGLQQIGDKLYLFDEMGKMVVNQQLESGGMMFVIDANGWVTVVPMN